MKYKVLNKDYEFIKENDLLNVLLNQRGVSDPKKLLNLDESFVLDAKNFKNIEKGLELLDKHIKNKSKIHIQIDSDVDGYTSAAVIYNYIKNINKDINITYTVHEGKQHGIALKKYEIEFDLLIVPDAGSEDVDECKMMREKGIDVLILDHHLFKKNNPYAILINCQDGSYENNTLSGVGVVYKFCKEYDLKFGYNYADNYLDLVALGMIADEMDLRNYETRYLALKGIEKMGELNNFISEIIQKQKNKLNDRVNIMGVGWYIAPLLNAVVRVGTQEEKEDVFRALIGEEEYRKYKPRKSKNNPNPEIENQSLQKFMARQCVNIKARQDRLVKKGVEAINKRIEDKSLNDNKVIIVDGTEDIESTFTGLVANKLSEQYKRPTILLRKKYEDELKIIYGGSCRNYRLSSIVSFMKFLEEVGTFDSLKGHDNAFGFTINANKVIKTKNIINDKLKECKIEDIHVVDYEIPIGRLKEKHIKQVGAWRDIWGNTISEPLFAITDIYISSDDIKLLGEKRNVLKFEKKVGGNSISFIKMFANEDLYNRMILKNVRGLTKKTTKKLKIDIIGKFKINEWNSNQYPQIEIVDFNSVENKDFLF